MQECAQVCLRHIEQELVDVDERDPSTVAPIILQAVTIGRLLWRRDCDPIEGDLPRSLPRSQYGGKAVAAFVVVKVEMLDANEAVKAQPLLQVRRFIFEDAANSQVMLHPPNSIIIRL